eukprot:6004222-Prymnesium_polylepis.1
MAAAAGRAGRGGRRAQLVAARRAGIRPHVCRRSRRRQHRRRLATRRRLGVDGGARGERGGDGAGVAAL